MNFFVKTKGHSEIIEITSKVAEVIKAAKIKNGAILLFVKGSTAALTIMEYEKGLINDLKNFLEKIAPENYDYQHHQKWGDHNGAAHLKASLIGPDLMIPLKAGKLQLGTWQQIVLIDFDEKPREREIIVSPL